MNLLTIKHNKAHNEGVTAKSVIGIETPLIHKGVKHAPKPSVFFCAHRSEVFNGRLGGPLRRAGPFVSVVSTRSVDLPMLETIARSKDNITKEVTMLTHSPHCCLHQRQISQQDLKQIDHLADFTRVLAQGVHWLRNDEDRLWSTIQTIISNQEQIRALTASKGAV